MTGRERDLSAFSRPPADRASGLAGRLPTRPAPAPPAPAPEAPAATPDVPPPAQTPPAGTGKRVGKTPKLPAVPDLKGSYSVYLPDELLAQVAEQLAGRTLGEFVLDGYDEVYERLEQRFRPPGPSRSGLPPRTRRPRRATGPLRERHPRWTAAEYAVLEARRLELGAPSRSAFVTAILELYVGNE